MMLRLFSRAALAGCGAGLVASLLQLWFVQPVLLHAELYEAGDLVHFGPGGPGPVAFTAAGFDPDRDFLTIFFTVLLYIGWAMILVPLMSLAESRGTRITARSGPVWGMAGFLVAVMAPAFTAAPGLPGVATIDIEVRQVWWLATVVSTGLGLWLLAFWRHPAVLAVAAVLLLAPHAIGLPQPEVFLGPVPPELAALMTARVIGVGLVAWAVLGALAGWLWERDAQRAVAQPA